jgi:hypothetical protein
MSKGPYNSYYDSSSNNRGTNYLDTEETDNVDLKDLIKVYIDLKPSH